MSRAQLTSTDQQNSGGPVSPFLAGKNKFINGDFNINQRNATSVTTNDTCAFDRWKLSLGTGGGSATYSAQTFTPGTAPVTGYESANYSQIVTASQSAAGDFAGIFQRIEDVRTLANQTATISFWAKAASGTPSVAITLEQNFSTGGSASVPTPLGNVQLSTSWKRYSITATVPSISGKTIGNANANLTVFLFTSIGSTLTSAGYGTLGLQNATISFWGMQLEAGSVATPFTTASGTLQGELALCQRYYWRSFLDGAGGFAAPCFAISTTVLFSIWKLPTTMRAAPTFLSPTVTSYNYFVGSTGSTASTLTLNWSTPNHATVNVAVSGVTTGQGGFVYVAISSGYLEFIAEL
jgi:hypothetical protein